MNVSFLKLFTFYLWIKVNLNIKWNRYLNVISCIFNQIIWLLPYFFYIRDSSLYEWWMINIITFIIRKFIFWSSNSKSSLRLKLGYGQKWNLKNLWFWARDKNYFEFWLLGEVRGLEGFLELKLDNWGRLLEFSNFDSHGKFEKSQSIFSS